MARITQQLSLFMENSKKQAKDALTLILIPLRRLLLERHSWLSQQRLQLVLLFKLEEQMLANSL